MRNFQDFQHIKHRIDSNHRWRTIEFDLSLGRRTRHWNHHSPLARCGANKNGQQKLHRSRRSIAIFLLHFDRQQPRPRVITRTDFHHRASRLIAPLRKELLQTATAGFFQTLPKIAGFHQFSCKSRNIQMHAAEENLISKHSTKHVQYGRAFGIWIRGATESLARIGIDPRTHCLRNRCWFATRHPTIAIGDSGIA